MNECEFPEKAEMGKNRKKQRLELLVETRSNQRENEVRRSNASSEHMIPLTYGDRFIPRRYFLQNNMRNLKYSSKTPSKDVLKMRFYANYWRQNGFTSVINDTMQIRERRFLQFHDTNKENCGLVLSDGASSAKNTQNSRHRSDWPCKPRKKPCAYMETTHDLPGFDSLYDPNLVDWSTKGQIAAAFGDNVVIWVRGDDATMVFKVKCIRSLAYSPQGDYLALGHRSNDYPVVELWHVESYSDIVITGGQVFGKSHLEINAITWTDSGKEIVCGTHIGVLYVLSVPDLKVVRKIKKPSLYKISMIKFSPNMRYLGCSSGGADVLIFNWRACDLHFVVRSRYKLNIAFDWHPWNGTDLVICENAPASIVILNVPNKEIVGFYQRLDTKIIINTVAFSKLTGELLVSISKNDGDGCVDFKVLVMSSLDRVVDLIRIAECGARFLMWSPDGSKLATTGSDETLTIWNFYNKTNAASNEQISSNVLEKFGVSDLCFGTEFKKWSNIR